MDTESLPQLKACKLGIDTYNQAIVFLRSDCDICRAEGFSVPARMKISFAGRSIIASLNIVEPKLLPEKTIGLSNYAWQLLGANENDLVSISHPSPLESLSYVRSKIYGKNLTAPEIQDIINDIAVGSYSDMQIASFVTACAGGKLSHNEIYYLTQAMIKAGEKLDWHKNLVVDKHCVGGLPGNRTTMIVVPIVAEFGLTIPKTSSRAIASPSGTADTMEVLTKVQLSLAEMQKVVEQENGCIVWGGTVSLSPADDILLRIERTLNLDNEGQMVASVLSKKVAAGSTHVLIDIPIGATAKLRSLETANHAKQQFIAIGNELHLKVQTLFTDGSQPIGFGIGPSLEARDVLAVLQCQANAPKDLRERALLLAGRVLVALPLVAPNTGKEIAQKILDSGRAFKKFQAICYAQGGLFEPKIAPFQKVFTANRAGTIYAIDNRKLATIAKLAGAPLAKQAGLELHANIGKVIAINQPLFTIHAETIGQLEYAATTIQNINQIFYTQH